MKIIEYTFQHRNDFKAILECEFCRKTQPLYNGYNDLHYHTEVYPNINCEACGLSTNQGQTQ